MKKTLRKCNEGASMLHLSRVELRCKLQEKLQCVSVPFVFRAVRGFSCSRVQTKFADFRVQIIGTK